MIDQHKSLSEKFLKKGFWLYLFSFIIAPIGYIIKIIISGELEVHEVGILYGIISLITLLSTFNDFGMTESLKYFIPQFVTEKKYNNIKTILLFSLFIQVITSLSIASFFFFGSEYISVNYFNTKEATDALKVFSFFFIGINIFQTITTFFLSIQDTFYQRLSDTLRMFFVMFCVIYIFILDESSLINYSYSWVVGLYIGVIFSIIIFYYKYYKKYFNNEKINIDYKLIKKITKYALIVFIGSSAGTILGQIDMQMIIYLLGTTQAGYYTNYLSIIGIPFLIIGPIFALLFPVFSELNSKKQFKKIQNIKEIFTKNFILIGIMFNIFFFIFAETIAYTLFGSKFIESGIILKYSILLLIFNFLLQINFNIMAGIGKINERLKIISIGIIFNSIMNIILINYIGVYGAALATGFGWLIIYLLSEYYLGKQYSIKLNKLNIIKNLTILGTIGFIIHKFFLIYISNISRIESFFVLGIIFILWFGLFILINLKQFKIFTLEIKKIKNV